MVDFETRSRVDLFLCGAAEYARDESTEILCAAWRLGTRETLATTPTESFSPFIDKDPPLKLLAALCNPNVKILGHNVAFERVIIRHVLSRLYPALSFEKISVNRFICTASLARAMALPGSLEKAAGAMRFEVGKDLEGRRAMMRLAVPMSDGAFCQELDVLKRVIEYCKIDIEVQTKLFLELPPLIPSEHKVWLLDQEINDRGFLVDRALVKGALSLVESQAVELRAEISELTNGAIDAVSKREQLLNYVNEHFKAGLIDLTKKRVEDKLNEPDLHPTLKAILIARQKGSKSSTAKYAAFEARSRFDGRCRENLVYHGASTGRFAGYGVQIQHLFRPSLKVTDDLINTVSRGEMLAGVAISEALPSLLRSVILPSEGCEMFCGDFAGIEARQVFWLAGHEAGLELYRSNAPLYKVMASHIFLKPVEEITDAERFLGKETTLGAGYGLGFKKFILTCAAKGVVITEELAKRAIDTYRELHAPVKQLWYDVENAAINAVRFKRQIFHAAKSKFFCQGDFLFIELPSGRRLAFNRPEIKRELTPWGQSKFVLHHMGVDSKTKGWVKSSTYGGKLVENICQGVSRDIMVEAMLALEGAGYPVLFTVHDEVACDRVKGTGCLDTFTEIMSRCPAWAAGSSIKVEAWHGPRYRK